MKFFPLKKSLATVLLLASSFQAQASEDFTFDISRYAPEEGVSLEQMADTQKRYKGLSARPTEDLKIPTLSHHIWLTDPRQPREMRPQDRVSLAKILMTLKKEGGEWHHFLWTNAKGFLPETLKWANKLGIQMNDINDEAYHLQATPIVRALAEEKKFGVAADFLRFDILSQMGGFYSDLNYMMAESPLKAMHTYDFLVHTDRGGMLVDVYMIAAKPGHPILVNAFETTLRNFQNPPPYVQLVQTSGLHIQEYTGVMTYWPFNFAFFKYVNGNTTDLAYPLETKEPYPAEAKKYYFIADKSAVWSALYGFCENTLRGRENAHIHALFDQYEAGEICMETILGFDSEDGDSWFEGKPLYGD
jgi:hypothetical protein